MEIKIESDNDGNNKCYNNNDSKFSSNRNTTGQRTTHYQLTGTNSLSN